MPTSPEEVGIVASALATAVGFGPARAGYSHAMSFIKGFVFGTFVGIAIGSAISESQRREIMAKVGTAAKRRVEPVAGAVADNTRQVADTAVGRAVNAIDESGDAAAAAVARD